jgi:hypothetical protein
MYLACATLSLRLTRLTGTVHQTQKPTLLLFNMAKPEIQEGFLDGRPPVEFQGTVLHILVDFEGLCPCSLAHY